jgi:hypothetical protein
MYAFNMSEGSIPPRTRPLLPLPNEVVNPPLRTAAPDPIRENPNPQTTNGKYPSE